METALAPPRDVFINAMLTDLYQITMAYAYFKNGSYKQHAVFDLFFRKNPFKGEYTIFAGLEVALRFIQNFGYSGTYTFVEREANGNYTEDQVEYIRTLLPKDTDEAFFDWLQHLDSSEITVYAQQEGTVVFPRIPMMRLEGPLGVVQLLETTLLNCINFPSLICTNAARMRLAAGKDKILLEFGLRRAQGPDGGMSASRYSYVGGFDGTSNVLAGMVFGMKVSGTHAHSFVTSFFDLSQVKDAHIRPMEGEKSVPFLPIVEEAMQELGYNDTNKGELAAFVAYAVAYPESTLCLVDTYDTLKSGVPNYLIVAVALWRLGYKAKGIRLDSGDLAYLSVEARKMFKSVQEEVKAPEWFGAMNIAASNDINEDTLHSLSQQGHMIDVFGIGTNLVTCQKQPALGCVFKLVELCDRPRIKLSNDFEKITLPGKKNAYRLWGKHGPVVDIITKDDEPVPEQGKRVICRHPFQETTQAYIEPTKVIPLLSKVYAEGKVQYVFPTLEELRTRAKESLATLRDDHKRELNPTPYKVSVSPNLYTFLHDLWDKEHPLQQLE